MKQSVSNRKKIWITMILAALIAFALSANVFAAYTAKVGNKKYKTIQKAVNAAKNGQTIKVLGPVKSSKTVTVSGKKITIDFAKKKYTHTGKKGFAFQLKSGQLTFKNMNITTGYGTAVVGKGAKLIVNNGSMTGFIKNNGTLLIKNGKFKAGGTSPYEDELNGETYDAGNPVIRNYGTLTIQKGSFYGKYRCAVENIGNAVLQAGTYTSESESKNYNSTLIWNFGNLRIDGGTYAGTIENSTIPGKRLLILDGKFKATNTHLITNHKGHMIITGGSFSTTGRDAIYNAYDDEYYIFGRMTITGGTFKTTSTAVNTGAVINEGEMSITGGTFLLNGKKDGALRSNDMGDEYTKYYIPASLGLVITENTYN